MVNWNSHTFYSRLGSFLFLNIILSLIFGGIYWAMWEKGLDFESFGDIDDPNNRFDPFYFSWVTQTTIGYGDHSPKSKLGKVLVCLQSFLFWTIALSFAILGDEENIFYILNPTNWHIPYSEYLEVINPQKAVKLAEKARRVSTRALTKTGKVVPSQ